MIEFTSAGSFYDIGFQHGTKASHLIQGSMQFYSRMFLKWSNMNWDAAATAALRFEPYLKEHVPHLVEEMRGIADGAKLPFASILALNARTEIALGLADDGCTSLAVRTHAISVAGQTWDWEPPQKERLVLMHINPGNGPKVSQVTEAGLVSKIGINSRGVGVFLNAIHAKGVNYGALPVHIALRVALESDSSEAAVRRLRSLGVATACHILIADKLGANSLEFSHLDCHIIPMKQGKIAHTNHFLVKHEAGVEDRLAWPDSVPRMHRVSSLLDKLDAEIDENEAFRAIEKILEDEDGFPVSINRQATSTSSSATLFSIVADLNNATAHVRLGRPTQVEGSWTLAPALL